MSYQYKITDSKWKTYKGKRPYQTSQEAHAAARRRLAELKEDRGDRKVRIIGVTIFEEG